MAALATPQPGTTHRYDESVAAQLAVPPHASEPDWLKTQRRQAAERYQTLGFPTRKNEAWKYIDLRPVAETAFTLGGSPVTESLLVDHQLPQTYPVVMINGIQLMLPPSLPEGMTLAPASAIEQAVGVGIETETDAFAALNAALANDVLVIRIAENIRIKAPVQVLIVQSAETEAAAAYNRVVVEAEAGSQAQLIVQTICVGNANTLSNTVVQLQLGPKANLNVATIQQGGARGLCFLNTQAQLQAGSHLTFTTATFEGQLNRHAIRFDLLGEGAHATLNGLNVLRDKQQSYNHTEIVHAVPHCTSQQVYKGILDDHSRSEFDGTVLVAPHAQGTDSSQLNKNLLLSENAVAFTRPQLRIDADDVKCSHGATVGQLDENELFYLASRGLGPDIAKCVLTFGFAEDALSDIRFQPLMERLHNTVSASLGHEKMPLSCFTSCDECPSGGHPN